MSKSFKIKIITPSYVPEGEKEVLASLNRMMRYGFEVDYSPRAISKEYEPFWGSMQNRAEEVIEALLGDYDAIWAVKGGYGVVQLMEYLDSAYDLLKKAKPKYLLGFSDITLLHCFVNKNLHWQSIHCNNFNSLAEYEATDLDAIASFMMNIKEDFELNHLELLNDAPINIDGSKVIAGNLCMIQNTLATPYNLDSKGSVLLIEDFDEPWYRIDRMLYHIYNASYMKSANAVVFGRLTADKAEEERIYNLIKKFAKLLEAYGVPVFYSKEFGHNGQNKPILCGGSASMREHDGKYSLIMGRKG